jgi:transposase
VGSAISGNQEMAKAYSDDLRRKILQAWEEGEDTQEQIAKHFRVSVRYIGKIVHQKRVTGQAERVPHQPGRKPRFTPPVREQIRVWIRGQPDLTLAEIQEKLGQGEKLRVSLPSIWKVLKGMGLRLKKNRSTRKSRISRGFKRSAKPFARK